MKKDNEEITKGDKLKINFTTIEDCNSMTDEVVYPRERRH